jgi:hypothetical protein
MNPGFALYARLHCQREELSREIVRFAEESCRARACCRIRTVSPPLPRERLDGRPRRHVRLFHLSQRLIQRMHSECKVEIKTPIQTLIDIGFHLKKPGVTDVPGPRVPYLQRHGFTEGESGCTKSMEISEDIQVLIQAGAPAREIKRQAVEEVMLTLRESGLGKNQVRVPLCRETVKN